MYNLNSHYENLFYYLSNIVTDPRLIYLHPFGTTRPENIESIMTKKDINDSTESPLVVCYDQEPIVGSFNFELFEYIKQNFFNPRFFILITTEKDSAPLDVIKHKYGCFIVYCFFHVFAAHDWFRGYRYDPRMVSIRDRIIKKKYISFNRLTSGKRIYRSLLLERLHNRNVLDQGYVSFNHVCPESGHYHKNLSDAVNSRIINSDIARKTKETLDKINFPLRIDYQDEVTIPNHSFLLSALAETQESFCYIVTETCFWEQKKHLTEKIFKPIVSRMPFILVGPAYNLEYLKSYGFRTFDKWFDESYDTITDPIQRLDAIADLIQWICRHSESELKSMLLEMEEVIEHNYNHFYSNELLDYCWKELTDNLNDAVKNYNKIYINPLEMELKLLPNSFV